jgi:hypothetical protein
MLAAIDPIIKQQVIAQYLQGVSRDTIAADNGIGTGTVSNFIDEQNGGICIFCGRHCTFCIPQSRKCNDG